MDAAALSQFEQVCQTLYEGTTPNAQREAQAMLDSFSKQHDAAQRAMFILERSQSAYAQLVACSILTTLVGQPSTGMSMEMRLQIRNYSLQYLYTNLSMQSFVVGEICKLIARITKLGWFDFDDADNSPFRDVLKEIGKFFQGSARHTALGLQLLRQLVEEMNQPSNLRGLTKHRKIASSFRDESLYDIFELGLNTLQKASSRPVASASAEDQQLIGWALQLVSSCLGYDFIGTCVDESVDDLRTVQVPANWRKTITNLSVMEMFFNLYASLQPPLSSHALACLVLLASVRRTLFTNAQRFEFLSKLIEGICNILRTKHGLEDQDNYHEFCRLVARLKTNHQLSELISVDRYTEVMTGLAEITIMSLENWHCAPNSVHYLMGLWDRMIQCIPHTNADKEHQLDKFSPQITEAFIKSRLNSVKLTLDDVIDDPLEDQPTLEAQLKQIATIARCAYEPACHFLALQFDSIAEVYMTRLQARTPAQAPEMRLLEGQLTWLVHILGAVVGGRPSRDSQDETDTLDGELICRCLQLLRMLDSQVEFMLHSEKLNLAMLGFFHQFRANYIGEQVQKSAKIRACLSERLGLEDEMMLLNVIVQKMVSNLRYWIESETIIAETLKLLSEFCQSFSIARKLVKLDVVKFMLENHTPENFPFLARMPNSKHRTSFYTSLGRMLMQEADNEEERFHRFVAPLTSVFEALKQQFSVQSSEALAQNEQIKIAVVGLVRDLRGIATACNSKSWFPLLFDWLYPDHMPVIQQAMKIWASDQSSAVPILKFMCEVVQNRNGRLNFGVSSPKGILLFRETSKMIVSYAQAVLGLPLPPPNERWSQRFKGITVCYNTLRGALTGSYVNFGVFDLYGDPAFSDALDTIFKLFVSIPLDDLNSYPKLCTAFYHVMFSISNHHVEKFARLSPDVFRYLMMAISHGVNHVESAVSTQCCNALDHIVTFVLNASNKTKPDPSAEQLLQLIRQTEDMFSSILSDMLNTIMFEECKNQWSMSRPMLGLILLSPHHFQAAQQKIMQGLNPNKQMQVAGCMASLMENVDQTLSMKNRDRFTQNLALFRREVNNLSKPSSG